MRASNRLIINTLAQYARTIINVLLSLYSARLVLLILGQSDFGLYSLVGGIVALLSFFTNSLVSATQRFLSIAQGKGNEIEVKEVFNNSIITHLALGALVVLVFELLTPVFFNGFLNIPSGREHAAIMVYHQVVAMLFISFIMSPYRAALISRENIVYISVIDVIDGVLKLVLVLLLPYASIDKLIAYGWIMLGIRMFNFLAFSVYANIKYEECSMPSVSMFKFGYVKELIVFAWWMMYQNFCIAGRNQGLAIVLNKMMSTIVNAAYGIGMQLSGYFSFLSSSFVTAVGPQLMKSEGGGNRQHMLYLAGFQSKISYLLLGMVAIPAIFEIDEILSVWLKDVPEYTSLFGVMFLASALIDQLTTGLGSAIQATGKIMLYSIVAYTPKFLILPLGWFFLVLDWPMWTVALLFFIIEAICMVLRLPITKKTINFRIRDFLLYVFKSVIIPTLVVVIVCFSIISYFDFHWRFLLTFAVSIPLYLIACYMFSLTEEEQAKAKKIWTTMRSKITR